MDKRFFELLLSTATKMDELSDDVTMKLAFICTLFDHICETNNLNKDETGQMIFKLIDSVNDDLGVMYKKEEN